jgi:hypothetical protein
MPNSVAALTRPCSVAVMLNSRAIRGVATPVMKTTRPSKNLPAAASAQIRHCIAVMGVEATAVPSAQTGLSSM